ncbi:unnamed protein product [Notodromas monacha]|uniref:Uncharacterized protein n=1 Tax=Notodromas monacha TaxID=399045 RepID=A0A7R9BWH6_9CRUS|nr:unnamed protein product [Notodromas monacha]CAG0921523.1 unnamed protein product [Notodromas monacha]
MPVLRQLILSTYRNRFHRNPRKGGFIMGPSTGRHYVNNKWPLFALAVLAIFCFNSASAQLGKTTQCWECEGNACNPLGRKRACNFDYCVETYHDDSRTQLLRRGCGNFYGPGCVWDNGEYHCFCIGDLCNRRLERTNEMAPPTCFDLIRSFLMGPGGLLLMALLLAAILAALVVLFHSCPEPEKLNMRQCREREAAKAKAAKKSLDDGVTEIEWSGTPTDALAPNGCSQGQSRDPEQPARKGEIGLPRWASEALTHRPQETTSRRRNFQLFRDMAQVAVVVLVVECFFGSKERLVVGLDDVHVCRGGGGSCIGRPDWAEILCLFWVC